VNVCKLEVLRTISRPMAGEQGQLSVFGLILRYRSLVRRTTLLLSRTRDVPPSRRVKVHFCFLSFVRNERAMQVSSKQSEMDASTRVNSNDTHIPGMRDLLPLRVTWLTARTSEGNRQPSVELKNGKVILKQKIVSFEKQSETLQGNRFLGL